MGKVLLAVMAVLVLSICAGCSGSAGGQEYTYLGYTGSQPANCDCD